MYGTINDEQVLPDQPIAVYAEDEVDLTAEKETTEHIEVTERTVPLESVRGDVGQVPKEKSCFEQACPLFTIRYFVLFIM